MGKSSNPNREVEAANAFYNAAEMGYAPSQNYLAWLYSTGINGKTDAGKAAYWYGKAAVQGDATAQFNFGRLYVEGRGVYKDIDEAKKWYRKSAEQGNEAAKQALVELGR